MLKYTDASRAKGVAGLATRIIGYRVYQEEHGIAVGGYHNCA